MSSESVAYYRSGLALLQHVEARQPTDRRFGKEADARWSQFKGELTTLDRLDILLRDADAQWPGAFGARTVFDLRGVAEDESFGAEWQPISGVQAEELWRAQQAAQSTDVASLLSSIADAWGLALQPVDVGTIAPADHIVLVGPSATAALIRAFADINNLDWAAQVIVVATPPGARQLAAAAGAILSSTQPGHVVAAGSPEGEAARARLKGKAARLVASTDATTEDLLAAQSLAGVS